MASPCMEGLSGTADPCLSLPACKPPHHLDATALPSRYSLEKNSGAAGHTGPREPADNRPRPGTAKRRDLAHDPRVAAAPERCPKSVRSEAAPAPVDKRLRLYDDNRGLDSDPAAFRKWHAGRGVSAARGICGKEKRVTLRESVEMKGSDGSNPTLSATRLYFSITGFPFLTRAAV